MSLDKPWDVDTACKKVLEHFIKERNKAVHCTICDKVLFSYQKTIIRYVYLLEVQHRKITWDMIPKIYNYMYENYPYRKDGDVYRHHISYKDDIQIPVCSTCHGKIHNIVGDPFWDKWKPIDKKPKNISNFKTKLYKPLRIEHSKKG